MNQQDISSKFEGAVCKIVPRPLFLKNEDGTYQEIMVQGFWSIWQDALATRPAAGEAGSVDDPDESNLRGLLHELVNAFGPNFDRTMNAIFGKFIAYGQKQFEHGRRSALEELHPQWMKEKERADRAEAAADDARKRAYHLANIIEDSNAAQPMQQEAGKTYLDGLHEAVRLIGLIDDGEAHAEYLACQEVIAAQIKAVEAGDNLQQASTAQAEHVRQIAQAIKTNFALAGQVNDLASLVISLVSILNRAKPGTSVAKRALEYLGRNNLVGDPLRTTSTPEVVAEFNMVCGKYCPTPDRPVRPCKECTAEVVRGTSQATPEGADLPPLPETDHCQGADGSGPLFTADQMHAYAKATIVAMTTKPVAWEVGLDLFRDHAEALRNVRNPSLQPEPLYRAAPPQQVDTGGLPG